MGPRERLSVGKTAYAADRLVDIVASAAPAAIHASDLDLDQLKARLFRSILKAELPFLENIPDLFDDLEREIGIRFGEESAKEKAPAVDMQAPEDEDRDQPVPRRA